MSAREIFIEVMREGGTSAKRRKKKLHRYTDNIAGRVKLSGSEPFLNMTCKGQLYNRGVIQIKKRSINFIQYIAKLISSIDNIFHGKHYYT